MSTKKRGYDSGGEEKNKFIPLSPLTCWRICKDYIKYNSCTL